MSGNKKILVVLSLVLAAGLLAGCGGSVYRANSIDDIPNGFDGPELLIVTDESATIRFDTGVPTVCNAPYGEDTDYGDIATIPMLSGATEDHVLTFSGLEAGRTYHYKIVATDNEGNVYQSGDYTFTTEAADPDQGINWLSLDAGASVVAVSSNFSGAANDESFGANSAIDDNRGTEWSSAGDGNDAFIEVALAEEVQISRLVVHSRSMSNDTAQIFAFNVITDSGETFGPFELPDADQGHSFEVNFVASSLRFEVVESNGGNTGFVDLEALGIATN